MKKHKVFFIFLLFFASTLIHCGSPVQFGGDQAISCLPGSLGCSLIGPPGKREQAVMSLGLLTKNTACLMCHMNISGDISGFGTMTFRDDSYGQILGNIYAADLKLQTWSTDSAGNYFLDPSKVDTVTDPNLVKSVLPELQNFNLVQKNSEWMIKPGEQHNKFNSVTFLQGGGLYSMTDSDPNKRAMAASKIIINPFSKRPIIHAEDFPLLNPAGCSAVSQGFIITADGHEIHSPVSGNLILVNGLQIKKPSLTSAPDAFNNYDSSCPANKTLEIHGEVVVNGDLVLSGCIHGQGSLYSTGSIYIPDDVKLANSPFPYPQTIDASTLQSDALSKLGKDMLNLGAAQFVLIGPPDWTLLNNPEQDPVFRNHMTALAHLFTWLSTGTPAQNLNLYQTAFLKKVAPWKVMNQATAFADARGAVSLVEASIYANLGVAGTFLQGTSTNLVVNGSIMTPNLSLLSTGYYYPHVDNNGQGLATNPFNGQPFSTSQINQDYRLKYSRMGFECHRIRIL